MRLSLAAGLCLLLASASQAAEPSPLSQVPSACPVVVHLRGAERTKERALTALENALPSGDEPAKMLREAQDYLDGALKGKLFTGRSLEGVPKDGSIFLALAELPEDPKELFTAVVLIAQVSDFAKF